MAMMRPTYSPDIMLGSNQMQGCFMVGYDNQSATAFLHKVDGKAFFVTANHALERAVVGDNVLFATDSGWVALPITGIWRDPAGYDACAFTVAKFGIGRKKPSPTGGHMFPGEPLKFLGFPHGLFGNYPGQGFPTPLVRTAYFSGIIYIDGLQLTVLDGFNNPGFSGGPVYITHESETSLCAMVSAYRPERESHSRIYRRNEDGHEEALPDLYTKPNSGMIMAIGIDRLKEGLFTLVDDSLEWAESEGETGDAGPKAAG